MNRCYFFILLCIAYISLNARNLTFYNATQSPLIVKLYSKNSTVAATEHLPVKEVITITYKPKKRLKLEILKNKTLVKRVEDQHFLESYTHFTLSICSNKLTVGGTTSIEGTMATTCQSRWFDDEKPPYPHATFYMETR